MRLAFVLLFLTAFETFSQDAVNPCVKADTFHIVVLGSSTAAGSGPSVSDSAWVNRYRTFLQQINPANQVTNLAIGGTTTYHIMPDWFVPPAGRPNPNPSNNVSQAISLNADAIIVNMPSNDAGNGFGLNEQMFNFITIFNVADSAGIPVWVCTTQPRNNYSATQIQIQLDVRDSIQSYFGNMAVDFWTGFATASNGLDPTYDSGDGTHMNDLGHRLLFNRVADENILSQLIDTTLYADHIILELYYESMLPCGDSAGTLVTVVANIGSNASSPVDLVFDVTDNLNAGTSSTQYTLTPLAACTVDTVVHIVNTFAETDLEILPFLTTGDTNQTNDTSVVYSILTPGYPVVTGVGDTVCFGDSSVLYVNGSGDTIVWYDDPTGGNIVHFGSFFPVNPLSSVTYYAEAVTGHLFYTNSVFTTANSNIDFNGTMFDIVALDSITIDSLSLKVATPGSQSVQAYRRNGSYGGHENNTSDWLFWGVHPVNSGSGDSFVTIDITDVQLAAGDTLGVYLHMLSSGSQLSYRSVANPVERTSNELKVITGSGIAYTFGTVYYPRDWNGEVYYHFGFNPQGTCTSERLPITLTVADPSVSLGNDTSLFAADSLTLDAGNGFVGYTWNTGDTTASITLDSSKLSFGQNLIWLFVTDDNGCSTRDTIVVTLVDPINGILETDLSSTSVYPNPSSGIYYVSCPQSNTYKLLGYNGSLLFDGRAEGNFNLNLSNLPAGTYILEITGSQGPRIYKRLIKF